MKNKVLVKVIVPELDISYDVYIPVNEVIWKIKKLIFKVVSDFAKIDFNQNIDCVFMNKSTCEVYKNNDIVINTSIRNGTELLVISKM